MLNNFIYAKTKDLFLQELNAGHILDEAIVFIENTKEIWNRGHYFGTNEIDPELINNLQVDVTNLQSNVATKQDNLVSGTNIKTINGESVLGEGDIVINVTTEANVQAVDIGETVEDVNISPYIKYTSQTLTDEQKAQARENIGIEISITNKGDGTKFLSDDGSYKSVEIPVVINTTNESIINATIKPNTYYVFKYGTELNITLETPTNTDILNNYMFEFVTSNEVALTLPSDIKWINDEAPVLELGNTYQVSIINNLATIAKYHYDEPTDL